MWDYSKYILLWTSGILSMSLVKEMCVLAQENPTEKWEI